MTQPVSAKKITRRAPVSSVRLRLALLNVLVLALALFGFGALVRQQVASDLNTSIDRSLVVRSQGMVRWSQDRMRRFRERRNGHMPSNGGPGGPGGPPNGPDHRSDHQPGRQSDHSSPPPADDRKDKRNEWDVNRPRVVDHTGKVAFGPDKTIQAWDVDAVRRCLQTGQPVFSTVEHGNGSEYPVRLYTEKIKPDASIPAASSSDFPQIAVQVATPLASTRQTVNQLTRTLLTLTPFALVMVGIGAVFLTDRALRPVRAVTHAAALIEAEDLSARLDVKGDDEFSGLAGQFNEMLARLEESFARREAAYEQQRRFVADASHELRTPLTVIKANTSLSLADPDLDPDYREVLREIDTATDRTIRIAQDLFLLARSDSGQLTVDASDVPLQPTLEQVRTEMARAHPDGAPVTVEVLDDGTIDVNGDPVPLSVWGDRNHILRLLTNLTENALRHTPASGSVHIVARASGTGTRGKRNIADAAEPPESIILEVIDTGEGIPPEHLPHLTERFYRVDGSRAREGGGTGLGLAICLAIAEAHGGTLSLSSKVGVGTTVRVILPRYASDL